MRSKYAKTPDNFTEFARIYSRATSRLARPVEEARLEYLKNGERFISVFSLDMVGCYFCPIYLILTTSSLAMSELRHSGTMSGNCLHSPRCLEFFKSKKWYTSMGIPHRMGYLLHGPPVCLNTIARCITTNFIFTIISFYRACSGNSVLLCICTC